MATQTGRRTLILDTSVFIDDPNCIEAFAHDTVVLSPVVIDRLDSLKWDQGERGEHARRALWNIYEYCRNGDIREGVATRSGGTIKIETGCKPNIGVGDPDSEILSLVSFTKERYQGNDKLVWLVSKSVTLDIKASVLGIHAIDYDGGNVHDPYAIFPGYFPIALKDRSPLVKLYKEQWVDLASIIGTTDDALDGLMPNQCVLLNAGDNGDTLAIYKKGQGFRLVPKPKKNGKLNSADCMISPRSCEQAFAYSLLMDPDIMLVVLIGSEGSGKTLMSLLAGYRQLRSEFDGKIDPEDGPLYGKMMVFRPNVEKGQPLGFLPGELGEKFEPWMEPIFDNMNLFLPPQKKGWPIADLMEKGTLEISPINYMRGRSIHDAFIIVDDAQNLKQDELKMLLTRPADGSKVVLTGGLSQIDHPYMNKYSNGLSRVIAAFIGQEAFGYTIMKQSEQRGLLAKLAAELL